MYLACVGKQLNILYSRYGKTIDDIILNSYMDLCVKFQVPGNAIQMYEIIKIWLSIDFEGGRHQRRIDKLDEH